MQRSLAIVDGRPRLALSGISPDDKKNFNALLSKLAASTTRPVQTMIDDLAAGFNKSHITADVVERFSKWCNTGGAYGSAVAPAREISMFLFGLTLERLIDSDGRPVEDYKQKIERMSARMK